MHNPYVYKITNTVTGSKYIGVRYADGCDPSDLMTTYFTSSKLVKRLSEEYGVESWEKEILGVFPGDPESAVLMEASLFPSIRGDSSYLNMCYSSGLLDPKMNAKAGRVGGKIVKSRNIGIFRNENDRRSWASLGGKISGRNQVKAKIGIHGQSREERLAIASKGGKLGAFTQPKWQSMFGKRGGIKNAGSSYYTDGKRTFKYTASMKAEVPFDEFMSENPQFRKGRTINARNQYSKTR